MPDSMRLVAFRVQGGMVAQIEGLDICGYCDMVSYRIVRTRGCRILAEVVNTGARYTTEARALIDKAQPGDTYIFEEIKARCPVDKAPRILDTQTFFIR